MCMIVMLLLNPRGTRSVLRFLCAGRPPWLEFCCPGAGPIFQLVARFRRLLRVFLRNCLAWCVAEAANNLFYPLVPCLSPCPSSLQINGTCVARAFDLISFVAFILFSSLFSFFLLDCQYFNVLHQLLAARHLQPVF
jgi:hypothetical protein